MINKLITLIIGVIASSVVFYNNTLQLFTSFKTNPFLFTLLLSIILVNILYIGKQIVDN